MSTRGPIGEFSYSIAKGHPVEDAFEYYALIQINGEDSSRPAATKIARIKLPGMSEFGTFETSRGVRFAVAIGC